MNGSKVGFKLKSKKMLYKSSSFVNVYSNITLGIVIMEIGWAHGVQCNFVVLSEIM